MRRLDRTLDAMARRTCVGVMLAVSPEWRPESPSGRFACLIPKHLLPFRTPVVHTSHERYITPDLGNPQMASINHC